MYCSRILRYEIHAHTRTHALIPCRFVRYTLLTSDGGVYLAILPSPSPALPCISSPETSSPDFRTCVYIYIYYSPHLYANTLNRLLRAPTELAAACTRYMLYIQRDFVLFPYVIYIYIYILRGREKEKERESREGVRRRDWKRMKKNSDYINGKSWRRRNWKEATGGFSALSVVRD